MQVQTYLEGEAEAYRTWRVLLQHWVELCQSPPAQPAPLLGLPAPLPDAAMPPDVPQPEVCAAGRLASKAAAPSSDTASGAGDAEGSAHGDDGGPFADECGVRRDERLSASAGPCSAGEGDDTEDDAPGGSSVALSTPSARAEGGDARGCETPPAAAHSLATHEQDTASPLPRRSTATEQGDVEDRLRHALMREMASPMR